ncbi:MAG TPA: cytochrome b5-like heme/steroid binding domain-containing protein [Candidatus Paceibacterota bacterium]
MNKIIIGVVVVVVVAVGGYMYFQKDKSLPSVTVLTDGGNVQVEVRPVSTTTQQGPAGSGYTLAEVATHATKSDCYTAVRGSVYDLTSWIGQHPGGAKAIEGLCGKDGTDAFVKKHGGQDKQEQTLVTFKIGELVR